MKNQLKQWMFKITSVACLTIAASAVFAQSIVERDSIADPREIWSAWGGEVELKVQQDVFADWGLQLRAGDSRSPIAYEFNVPVQNTGSIEFHSPFGNFAGFVDGSIRLDQVFSLSTLDTTVQWSQLTIQPTSGFTTPTFLLRDGSNNPLFIATNMHVYVGELKQNLVMERMDVQITKDLAERLGNPALENQFIGQLALTLNLNIPAGANTQVRGGTCQDRPKWPTDGFVADVGLETMNTIQDVGTVTNANGTFELIAPSSSLRSLVGLNGADVAWYRKFSGTFPPYNNDQHPYLIWNLYRVNNDGIIEQIGRSGLKHAFLTVNTSCTLDCGDNHILWPGCGDVYPVGNNDADGDLGPRFEVNPLSGMFVSTGSFFDPGSTGDQTNSSSAPGENRMQVLREDLQTASAQYFFESWYVIRDDSNIYNSMGYRPITPANPGGGNGWSYSQQAFVEGPVIDQWVPPATDPATGSQNVTYSSPDRHGHFKLAVKTDDLGGGQFRYTYMLMSFDVANGISELNLNSSNGGVSGFAFNDGDQDTANDWTQAAGANLSFVAASGDEIPWGNGYTFSFIGGEPSPGQATVRIGDISSSTTVDVDILTPDLAEEFLIDGFESPE